MLNKISKQIQCSCCIVVRDSRYVYLQERVSNIHWSSHSLTVIEYSAALQYVSVCALGTFVFSVSGDGETTFGSHDLLKAETKVQAIKSALTNNSAKHNLAKRGSPDECITTLLSGTHQRRVQLPIDQTGIDLSTHSVLKSNRSRHKYLLAPFVTSRTRSLENIETCFCHF